MKPKPAFSRTSLNLDPQQEIDRLVEFIRSSVHEKLHRQGAVVAISGGIDSAVVMALCARALSPERVLGLLLPERESSPESKNLALELAARHGVETVTEDISAALEGAGCYQRRDEAIGRLFPDYAPGWSAKIVLPASLLDQGTLNIFRLTVSDPQGQEFSKRLPPQEFAQIVAASNFKQRLRMSMLYYHSERKNYAAAGTPNKNEHDLGFFVKYGDGGSDFAPIAHLFKTQVYQIAACLDIPQGIIERTPTTDTYPGGSSQEEFFYRLPFEILDSVWYGMEHGFTPEEIAAGLDLTPAQVGHITADIISKKRTTEYLRMQVLMA